MQHDQEFVISLTIIGGIVFAGSLIIGVLTLVGMAVYNRVTKSKITKELYNEKERKNGQHKGGSKGSW